MQQCRSLGIEFERVDVFDAKPRNVVGLVRERLATGEFAALCIPTLQTRFGTV